MAEVLLAKPPLVHNVYADGKSGNALIHVAVQMQNSNDWTAAQDSRITANAWAATIAFVVYDWSLTFADEASPIMVPPITR
ncbi:uncharacterized protein PHACADRAFT_212359 [Phanerochaete carnosa HHB-10118-sp]|uniref:Uncharacterized protein n=1 Tax=Phanerochaete carnosa (strain HHB-10118-sp) TaxID=650164 RepID=K5WN35_PHACS|nr:uncharacterized protein PHACADRAFT_212359 [Phanerochaete carnosa HHB-10118-sp]EKM51737.1 hypothetical protein PHACADRAFT_212359 [Phanerochaete carnosa HHB-10118-sp]